MLTPAELLSLGALGVSTLALAWQVAGPGRERRAAVVTLGTRLAVLEARVEMLLLGIGRNAALALHSPHSPALDVLLEAFAEHRASQAQCADLAQQLRALCDDPRETVERKRYARDVLLVLDAQQRVEALRQGLPHHLPS